MQGRIGGRLTETGRRQAAALGRLARQLGIERILCSGLSRAVETATLVADEGWDSFEALEELAEIDCGLCSGLTKTEIEQRFPGLLAERRLRPWEHRWPGGESMADAVRRLARILDVRLRRSDRTRTLVIAHQGVNRALVHLLGGLPIEQATEARHPWEVVVRFAGADVSHRWFADGDTGLDACTEDSWIVGPCTLSSIELGRARVSSG